MSLLIVNYCSQNGKAKKKWASIQNRFRHHTIFEIRSSEDWQKVEPWLLNNYPRSKNQIIAAGGDGTVHSVIQMIMKYQLPAKLGMIGLGSSNDYHKPHCRNYQEWEGGVPVRIRFDAAKPHDLIRFTIQNGDASMDRWSGLNGSVGITANGNAIFNRPESIPSRIKPFSVNAAIAGAAIQAFVESQRMKLDLRIDSEETISKHFVNLGVFKRAYFSGSFRYDRTPEVDDGKIGIATLDDCSKISQFRVLTALSNGRFSELKHCNLKMAKQLQIQSPEPFTIEIDGEIVNANNAHIQVAQRALMMCP